MEYGMYELVKSILQGVSFIAIGGALALMFFVVFAPVILGSKTTHKQIENLSKQLEKISRQLEDITRKLNDKQ